MERILEVESEALNTTFLALHRGLVYLSQLVHRPPRWKVRAHRAFDKESREHMEKLPSMDAKLLATIAESGG